ncbi:ABC transporter substrate-binding protein [Hyphomicrobium sp.]|uniref:ABC transporter substrate-binding protein n=1 Tax=Hyphomicrobium sp. TaxID=82 RepID=UPI002E35D365|nr:ABC transporter substrate-binding protein [Hyphomicrobium sp.]HEX2842968.1 ABC transporter substrate-binding protein [Hyphomicrobium sp.]
MRHLILRMIGCLAACIGLTASALSAPAGGAPQRVVSMNLCTDQLAMLVAGEGQLHSVSYLAIDPEGSVLAEEARRFPINHGRAEEIFMMHPDLVLSGTFTGRATVALLKRLGFHVEEFPPSYSFPEIREQVRRMGRLLGRESRAEELVQELDTRLTQFPDSDRKNWRPLAALHYANSYTSGSGTLASAVVERSGLENLGTKLGLVGTIRLPLEVLVASAPDLIIGGVRPSKAPALAYQTFEHPALRAVLEGGELTSIPDKYWVCGAPFTAQAVGLLSAQAQALRAKRGTGK